MSDVDASGLQRLPDWRVRFEATCDQLRAQPFAWGENDCGVGLAARLVAAVTGVDLAAQWRGHYASKAGALKALKETGFDTLGDFVASLLPEYPEGPSRAKIGDLVAIEVGAPFGHALGVVNGERVFVLTEDGHGTVDLLSASRAYKVG